MSEPQNLVLRAAEVGLIYRLYFPVKHLFKVFLIFFHFSVNNTFLRIHTPPPTGYTLHRLSALSLSKHI